MKIKLSVYPVTELRIYVVIHSARDRIFALFRIALPEPLCQLVWKIIFFSKDCPCPWTHWLLENLILLKLSLNSFDLINMMVNESHLFFQFYALFCHHPMLRCCVMELYFNRCTQLQWQCY